jgi:hypothetical protein
MFIYNIIYKQLNRAAKRKLAYTTDNDRFRLIEVVRYKELKCQVYERTSHRLACVIGWLHKTSRVTTQ